MLFRPTVQVKPVVHDALRTERRGFDVWANVGVEAVARHAEIGGRLAGADQAGQDHSHAPGNSCLIEFSMFSCRSESSANWRDRSARSVMGEHPSNGGAIPAQRARDRAGLIDVHFHDSRHWAATMMARKLPLVDLCRMFGWKDPKHALIYYNATASSIAALLDK